MWTTIGHERALRIRSMDNPRNITTNIRTRTTTTPEMDTAIHCPISHTSQPRILTHHIEGQCPPIRIRHPELTESPPSLVWMRLTQGNLAGIHPLPGDLTGTAAYHTILVDHIPTTSASMDHRPTLHTHILTLHMDPLHTFLKVLTCMLIHHIGDMDMAPIMAPILDTLRIPTTRATCLPKQTKCQTGLYSASLHS